VDILITLIVGGVIGWLASVVMKTSRQMGILANIVVGIVGSALGSLLFGALGLFASNPVGRIIVNMTGAVILIVILKRLRVYR
jgi:uncharacterized membrane protein YeaQ/YmgE (transglycosylase-associated protein family)